MSLLLNRSLHLHIGQQYVRGALHTKRAPHKVLGRARQDFKHGAPQESLSAAASSTGELDSMAVNAVLSELLASADGHRPRLSVVMADPYIHFDVVHGEFGSASDRHLQSIADACIAEVLGDAAAGQHVRWQLQSDQRHLLISSIYRRDVATVIDAASIHGIQVQSIQPEFFVQWNHFGRATPTGQCVFATVNEDYLTVAFVQQGVITALSCGPCVSLDADKGDGQRLVQMVDLRASRLLASLGQPVRDVSSFMLVTSAVLDIQSGSRWTAFRVSEDMA